MDVAHSGMDNAKKEKETLIKKIEKFILDVYELNLMNESVSFLNDLKNSSIKLTNSTKKKLFSRLFFIENVYRKQFEQFEQVINSAGENYKTSAFEQTPQSLIYSAERIVKAKKFKGKIHIKLYSEWSIYNNAETKQFSSSKRFALSDSELRRIQLNVLSDEETQNYINSAAEKSKEQPGKYMPLSDELSTWLKENLFVSVPDSGVTNISITIRDYSGVVNKRTGKRKTTQTLKGALALTVAEDGSITSITDLTNAGLIPGAIVVVLVSLVQDILIAIILGHRLITNLMMYLSLEVALLLLVLAKMGM